MAQELSRSIVNYRQSMLREKTRLRVIKLRKKVNLAAKGGNTEMKNTQEGTG